MPQQHVLAIEAVLVGHVPPAGRRIGAPLRGAAGGLFGALAPVRAPPDGRAGGEPIPPLLRAPPHAARPAGSRVGGLRAARSSFGRPPRAETPPSSRASYAGRTGTRGRCRACTRPVPR